MLPKLLSCTGLWILLFLHLNTFSQNVQYDPPWNKSPESAVDFTIRGIDNVPDLYGDINDPQLIVFFAGNQYMVIDELLAAFKKEYPEYKRVFAETLPPGILAKQINGGSLTIGNMRLTLKPDIYTAGKARIEENSSLFSEIYPYAKNSLAIMVRKGNPKQIHSLKDLGRADVRVSMPNPAWEGVALQIEKAYEAAGGEKLKKEIMEIKVRNGSTTLTHIHHRQTPLNILYDRSDAGPVWLTEALYHKKIHPLDVIRIPAEQNREATYFAGLLKKAPHPVAAKDFLNFLKGKTAQDIYKKFGFEMPVTDGE